MAQVEKNERVKRKTLAMLEKQRQAAIRRDMGFFDFYAKPSQRKYAFCEILFVRAPTPCNYCCAVLGSLSIFRL